MVQSEECWKEQNEAPSAMGLSLVSIIPNCLDDEIAVLCKGEIETLGKVVEYYVQHTVARNETASTCEKEKRFHLESQLKDAFNILDNVRAEIEETKQRHLELVSHLKAQRAQLKQDKTKLSTELANMNNEVARLHLMKDQICKIELRIHALNENCKYNHHTDQSQVRHISARMLPNSDRTDLERELSVSRDVLYQQEANIATLRQSITRIGGSNAAKVNDAEQIQRVEFSTHRVCHTLIEPSRLRTVASADPNSTDVHLLNALHSIHSLFAGNVNKINSSKGEITKVEEEFQKRVAERLLQSEQKSIAELNSKMNKHIETLTMVLNSFPHSCAANLQK